MTVKLTPEQIKFLESSIDNFNISEWNVELAGQAASTRRFFRVYPKSESSESSIIKQKSRILVLWDSNDEDWPRFFEIETHVASTIRLLPKIYASDPAHGFILEEDLGAVTLKKFCLDNSGNLSLIETVYRQVIDALCAWHRVDTGNCNAITSRMMDVETFLWESDYFARHCAVEFFAKGYLLTADWESERKQLAEYAAGIPKVNMHRDFQSENILICNGRVRFVDHQGARLGPPHYDLASLLLDPYVTQLGDNSVGRLADYYFDKQGLSSESEKKHYYVCAAQRLMQALGAYANLSINKEKPRYREFIPIALKRLSSILDEHLPDYPAIRAVAGGLI